MNLIDRMREAMMRVFFLVLRLTRIIYKLIYWLSTRKIHDKFMGNLWAFMFREAIPNPSQGKVKLRLTRITINYP